MRGGEWNEWLRDCVPEALMAAMEACRAHPSSSVGSFLRVVPLPGEVLGFFHAPAAVFQARLRASACMPTAGGEWVRPAAAFLPEHGVEGDAARRLLAPGAPLHAAAVRTTVAIARRRGGGAGRIHATLFSRP